MATPVGASVDSGGTKTFEDVNAAQTAKFGATSDDLVANDEAVTVSIFNTDGGDAADGFFQLTGQTVDATRNVTIEVADGYKHNGKYDAEALGNIGRLDVDFDAALLVTTGHTHVKDLMVIQRPDSGGYASCGYVTETGVLFERCMFIVDGTAGGGVESYGFNWNIGGGKAVTVRNCVILTLGSTGFHYGAYQATTTGGVVTFEHCVIIGQNRGCFIRAAGGAVFKNTFVRGMAAEDLVGTPGASTGLAYDDAGADVDTTGFSLSQLFRDPNNGDFRPLSGSPLVGAGTAVAGVSDDILGAARPTAGAVDIGAFEGSAPSLTRTFFLVERDLTKKTGLTRVGNGNKVICEASGPESARDLADSLFAGDSAWDDSTVTALESSELYSGSRWVIRVGGVRKDSEYTAGTGDTIGAIGAALAAALNVNSEIANAAWVSPTLTVAGAADGLGDQSVEVFVYPEGSEEPIANSEGMCVGTITHRGVAGAALSVVLNNNGVPRKLVTI